MQEGRGDWESQSLKLPQVQSLPFCLHFHWFKCFIPFDTNSSLSKPMTHYGKHINSISWSEMITSWEKMIKWELPLCLTSGVTMSGWTLWTRENPVSNNNRKMYRCQELNKDPAKLKLNIRMYGWTSEEEKWRQKESERGNEPKNNRSGGKITACGHYKKWKERQKKKKNRARCMDTCIYVTSETVSSTDSTRQNERGGKRKKGIKIPPGLHH